MILTPVKLLMVLAPTSVVSKADDALQKPLDTDKALVVISCRCILFG